MGIINPLGALAKVVLDVKGTYILIRNRMITSFQMNNVISLESPDAHIFNSYIIV